MQVTSEISSRTQRLLHETRERSVGNLLVFNVSGSVLFQSPPSDPYLPASANKILRPIKTITFQRDCSDGELCNVLDCEIDGNYAYCALGRAGIGIVDISSVAGAYVLAIIDTPGMALGITLRTELPSMNRQMLVGDSRCGVRLYGRLGE